MTSIVSWFINDRLVPFAVCLHTVHQARDADITSLRHSYVSRYMHRMMGIDAVFYLIRLPLLITFCSR